MTKAMTAEQLAIYGKVQDDRTEMLLLLIRAKRAVLLAAERAGRDITEQEHQLIDDINVVRVAGAELFNR